MNQFRVSFQCIKNPDVKTSDLTTLANNAGYDVTGIVDHHTTVLILDDGVTERPIQAKRLGLCTMTVSEFIVFATERIAWRNREAVRETA
mgnify:CR=1 FL=1